MMGVRASFERISSRDYLDYASGVAIGATAGTRFSIDKAWRDFHLVFQTKGDPLRLAISGNAKLPACSDDFDIILNGNAEYYIGLVSPELVKRISAVLRQVTVQDYKEWESAQFGEQFNLGERLFLVLKAAYEDAAGGDDALMIVIC